MSDDEKLPADAVDKRLPTSRKARRKLFFGKSMEKPLRSRVQRTHRKKRAGGSK